MNRRLKLIHWVRARHQGQLMKETYAPYLDHLLAVANRAAAAAPLTFEIGCVMTCWKKLQSPGRTFGTIKRI
jgi:hypothetical protein